MPKKKRFEIDAENPNQTGKYHDRIASETARFEPALWQSNPEQTAARFPESSGNTRRFDFGSWYDGRTDAVTRACQQVIEAMLEERGVAPVTVLAYCRNGLNKFLGFCRLWSSALDRPMALTDIDSALIERLVLDLKGQGIGAATQRSYYTHARSVLLALGRRGWIETDDLFPRNPFPHANRTYQGEKPLSTAERRRVVTRLKADLAEIQQGDKPLTSNELAVCMLGIAVRSGINPVPLTELSIDCIQAHPIKHDRKLLVSYKRRGQATQVQALRRSEDIQLLKTVMMDVDAIVDLVRPRNAEIRASSAQYADRLFVYLSRHQQNRGQVRAITLNVLHRKIPSWSARHGLLDDSGKPMTVNCMRLRKTFENRIWALSGQDPIVTARLGGHSLKVSNDHYLEAPPEAEKNFRLLGEVLTRDLLDPPEVVALPAENTPVSQCRDSLNGQFAPHADGERCTHFLACVRCRSFVVTEDDLHRLFSFYWLLVHERESIGARTWARHFGHIIRIIDRDIAPRFPPEIVAAERAKARASPHPFWRNRDQLEDAV
jgi:hypothetical protein